MVSRFNPAKIITYFILTCVSFVILFPMYLTLVTPFKTMEESSASFVALPKTLNFDNFKKVIEMGNYLPAIKNSFIITVIATVIAILFNAMVAYFIVRNERKRFYKFIYFYFIIAMFIPFQVLMLPLIKTVSNYNMMSIPGLIFLYILFSFPNNIFLYGGFIKNIPLELEEAAIIDGCTRFGVFFRVVLPLLKTITATVAVLTVLWIWNDFLLPLLILSKDIDNYTLPLFQFNFTTKYTTDYNLAFASYLTALIPPIILYLFCQKYIINGISEGAIKG
ncbi:MAG: carbohydrate ABC transporter permease [Clostridia bacterium]|nr:carbohydrate ABC transporter permease [Clostridia bacterium]